MEFSVVNRVKEWEEETDGQQEPGVRVKEEPEWTGGLDSRLKSVGKVERGMLELYAGHKVEGDLALGSEGPQLSNSAFTQPACASSLRPDAASESPERLVALGLAGCIRARHGQGTIRERETDRQWECMVEIKVECEDVPDGQQQHAVYIKEEPEWPGDLDSSLKCNVKEESGLQDLYTGHKVEKDLVLGPEGPQPPDSAFAQPTCASSQRPSAAREGPERPVHPAAPGVPGRAAGRDRARRGRGRIKQKPGQEKPYSCEVCLKQFKKRNYLVAHKRTHTEERPYSCDECMKQFKQKNHLVTHIRTHTGERLYSCDVCAKQFARKSTLGIHRRTHTGERPYACDVCTKQFTDTNTLVRHRRTHTGERPYSCDVCDKKFVHRNTLVLHQRTHSGKEPQSSEPTVTPAQSQCYLKVSRPTDTIKI